MNKYAKVLSEGVSKLEAESNSTETETIEETIEEVTEEETTEDPAEDVNITEDTEDIKPKKKGAEQRIAYLTKQSKQKDELITSLEQRLSALENRPEPKVEIEEEDIQLDDTDDLLKYLKENTMSKNDFEEMFQERLKNAQMDLESKATAKSTLGRQQEFASLLEAKYKAEGKDIEFMEDYELDEISQDAQQYIELFNESPSRWLRIAKDRGFEALDLIIKGEAAEKNLKKKALADLQKASKASRTEKKSESGVVEVDERPKTYKEAFTNALKKIKNERKE